MNVPAAKVAEELGFTPRHWTRQAAQGKVPGASQPFERGRWMFDLDLVRRWWRSRQREVSQWRGSTSEARSGGAASSVKAKTSGRLSTQEIDELLRGASGSG